MSRLNIVVDSPIQGVRLAKTIDFVKSQGLSWEEKPDSTVNVFSGRDIVATGSRHRNVFKCIAALPHLQGEGLATKVVTELVKDGIKNGFSHFFVYTTPNNTQIFTDLGFTIVGETPEVILLENISNGVGKCVNSIKEKTNLKTKDIGAVVVNCNPFTKGHLYLIEKAKKNCKYLFVFVLSEDVSMFSAEDRIDLVKKGTKHLKDISIYPTENYLVSYATFPQYFLKKEESAEKSYSQLDISVFVHRFAIPLGITKRFVGTEPHSAVTNAYNQEMKKALPQYGIELIEIERIEKDGEVISATRVRQLYTEGKLDEIKSLVPTTTYNYLKEHYRREK